MQMGFPSRCVTNAQALDGFATVYYIRLTIQGSKARSDGNQSLVHIPSLDDHARLEQAIYPIRQKGGLVTSDPSQLALWVFAQSKSQLLSVIEPWKSNDAQRNPFHPANGFGPTRASLGDFKAADLADREPDDFSSSDLIIHGDLHARNIKAMRVNAMASSDLSTKSSAEEPGGLSPSNLLDSLYSLFIQACIKAVSFAMVCRNIVPVNFSTFITDVSSLQHPFGSAVAISVQLSSSGTLVFHSTSRPTWLAKLTRQISVSAELGKRVVCAPLGVIGTIVRDDVCNTPPVPGAKNEADDLGSDPFNESTEPCCQAWMMEVMKWLGHRGFVTDYLTEGSPWVQVLVDVERKTMLGSTISEISAGYPLSTIWWPKKLCFVQRIDSLAADPETCFSAESEDAYEDPLDFAIKWFMGQAERDKLVQEITPPEGLTKTGDSVFLNSSDASGFLPLPTVSHDDAIDASGTAGIYPTPPDGFFPNNAAMLSPERGIATGLRRLSHHSAHAVGSESIPTSLVTLKEDDPYIEEAESQQEALFENDNDDDLFENNGITEDDFSFFDEPENAVDSNAENQALLSANEQARSGDGIHDHDLSTNNQPLETRQDGKMSMEATLVPEQPPFELEHAAKSKSREQHSMKPPASPPLSPHFVKRKPLSNRKPLVESQGWQSKRKGSHNLDAIQFDARLDLSDRKYHAKGRYGSINTEETQDIKEAVLHTPLTRKAVGIPLMTRKRPMDKSSRHLPQARFQRMSTGGEASWQRERVILFDTGTSSDRDDSSSISSRMSFCEIADEAKVSDETIPHASANAVELHDCASCIINIHYMLQQLVLAEPDQRLDLNHRDILLQDLAYNPGHFVHNVKSDELVAVAQIMCNQFSSTTIQHLSGRSIDRQSFEATSTHSLLFSQDDFAQNSSTSFLSEFEQAASLSLRSLAGIRETPNKMAAVPKLQPKQTTRRANMPRLSSPGSIVGLNQDFIFDLPTSHVKVSRTDSRTQNLWAVLPTALKFWDILGLAPCNGGKDVQAYCVYSAHNTSGTAALRFLDTIGAVYENGRLGSHTLGLGLPGFEDGLIPINVELGSSSFDESLTKFGSQLRLSAPSKVTVLYMVNFEDTAPGFTNICNMFRIMQEGFGDSLHPSGALVFQALPLRTVSAVDGLSILDPEFATQLAKEVYDRCQDLAPKQNSTVAGASPCVELDEVLPQRVQFRLSEYAMSALGHGDVSVHVAYSISPSADWIVASWIHKTGTFQASVPYCLKGRTFAEVAEEIWEITLSARPSAKAVFAVYICKVGVMESVEKKVWMDLSRILPNDALASVCILSVNPDPALQVFVQASVSSEPSASVPPTPSTAEAQQQHQFQTSAGLYNTPMSVSTPQSMVLSPAATPPPTISRARSSTANAFKVASTPPASILESSSHQQQHPPLLSFIHSASASAASVLDADPSAHLIDMTDESWAIILPRRLNVSASNLRIHRALASGYLMRRSSVVDADPPALCEVNLLFSRGASPHQGQGHAHGQEDEQVRHDAVLREVLGMYRNLATLAVARGVVGGSGREGVLPWHVASARRAAMGVGVCLPVGEGRRGRERWTGRSG